MTRRHERGEIDIAELIPYANNARTHSQKQIDHLKRMINDMGFINPVVIDERGELVAGHGRTMAATELGITHVPFIRLIGFSPNELARFRIEDNSVADLSGWDMEALVAEIEALGLDVSDMAFDDDLEAELAAMLKELEEPEEEAPAGPMDAPPPNLEAVEISQMGDVWRLGRHRVMCGDSTDPQHVALLVNGEKAALLHADPPYGMGKASDGVANDNLYNEKLDEFQMAWWRAFRPQLMDNASAYIWGNAPELWRLWYCGGLRDSEVFELRNEIVWDKSNIPGMASPLMTQYPEASERCLYFQFGKQFVENINSDEFPGEWEPLKNYLEAQAKLAGIGAKRVKEICGVGMYSHWFTKSQFSLIPKEQYEKIQIECSGFFGRPWSELKKEWDCVKDVISSKVKEKRTFFDNSHESMYDVWKFPRVVGEERHGHATPKPVPMMERVMKSSLPKGGLCLEPFGGSGSTLMGAEATGRTCYTMELQPKYIDVIVRRWQSATGRAAIHEVTGKTFDETAAEVQGVSA